MMILNSPVEPLDMAFAFGEVRIVVIVGDWISPYQCLEMILELVAVVCLDAFDLE